MVESNTDCHTCAAAVSSFNAELGVDARNTNESLIAEALIDSTKQAAEDVNSKKRKTPEQKFDRTIDVLKSNGEYGHVEETLRQIRGNCSATDDQIRVAAVVIHSKENIGSIHQMMELLMPAGMTTNFKVCGQQRIKVIVPDQLIPLLGYIHDNSPWLEDLWKQTRAQASRDSNTAQQKQTITVAKTCLVFGTHSPAMHFEYLLSKFFGPKLTTSHVNLGLVHIPEKLMPTFPRTPEFLASPTPATPYD